MQNLTLEERTEISQLAMELLESWKIPPAAQVRVIGMPQDTRPRAMRRYHDSTPFPDEPHIWERLVHLFGIADALRTTYPRNAQMGAIWMHRRNQRFANRTPLQVIIEEGLEGLIAVRALLDCAFDWDLSGSSCRPA